MCHCINFVIMETWHPQFVHPWTLVLQNIILQYLYLPLLILNQHSLC